jgi:hypothetical protein
LFTTATKSPTRVNHPQTLVCRFALTNKTTKLSLKSSTQRTLKRWKDIFLLLVQYSTNPLFYATHCGKCLGLFTYTHVMGPMGSVIHCLLLFGLNHCPLWLLVSREHPMVLPLYGPQTQKCLQLAINKVQFLLYC